MGSEWFLLTGRGDSVGFAFDDSNRASFMVMERRPILC